MACSSQIMTSSQTSAGLLLKKSVVMQMELPTCSGLRLNLKQQSLLHQTRGSKSEVRTGAECSENPEVYPD
ncbi:hypothetical protein EYF80_056736 [Liparis tanakae]|uniref:Uncharacterized protein n=1 Tax=Liparis tanakae TaxID=230148 RepID=A0A4Z2EWB3_9TELE|nr:hypothetical protein EYF80_056736 [Liparis tanakae]